MEERSKTNKQIFKEKYPAKEFAKSPMACAEAIGYLKGRSTRYNRCRF